MTDLKTVLKHALDAIEASEACEDCPFDYDECHGCKYEAYAKRNP